MKSEPDRGPQDKNQRPPGDDEHDPALAAALADYVDLLAESEDVDTDAFCRRYPDLLPRLRAAILTLNSIDDLAEEARPCDADEEEQVFSGPLSGHRLLNEIGSGGMARVFLALDERLGRKVAIKVLKSRYWDNEPVRVRFMNEARALAQLNHSNIVRIYNLGRQDEPPHFVMEFVEGVPLTVAAAPLSLRQRVELFCKVLMAVHFLHQSQIIHRDLKPGNILVGADLEPRLLDFGLARQVEGLARRITVDGELLGTPQYFSPEQAQGKEDLDRRSDIFSLGTILYEMMTGLLPFHADNLRDQVRGICHDEPLLPRRLDNSIPGELQNICMQALEKEPANRYATAAEMADDLERFLAGEPVLAAPSSYAHRMAGKIAQHMHELEGWREDQILSDYEFDALRRSYDRLVEREDAWIMEVRRLSLPQVGLYLGAWCLVVGAALIFLFRYLALSRTPAVLLVSGVAGLTAWYGVWAWKSGRLRIAVAYLLAFCLLLPVTLLVIMQACRIFSGMTHGREDLEFLFQFPSFQRTTNAQFWWSICLSLPVYLWLRRFTRSSVFSLILAIMAALLCGITLLRMGLLEWLDKDPGRIYLRLIPAAALFYVTAILLEHFRRPWDSRYFYPIAVAFTYLSLSGIAAFHEPYANWLRRVAPWTRGQVDYLFIINAGIYFLMQFVCDRFRSAQMRVVAKAFRFVLPGHILIPLFLLGMEATRLWTGSPASTALHREARIFEMLLPLTACLFVFLSIPKQMKNYLATGMLFMAVGIIRLQQNWLKDHVAWPVTLILAGILLMFWAARYSAVRAAVARLLHRTP